MQLETKRKLECLGEVLLLVLICICCYFIPLFFLLLGVFGDFNGSSLGEVIGGALWIGALLAFAIFALGLRILYKKYQSNK